MIATIEITNPKAQQYTKKEIENILINLLNNYFEEEKIDGKLYFKDFSEMTKEEINEARNFKEKFLNMSEEEKKNYFVNI